MHQKMTVLLLGSHPRWGGPSALPRVALACIACFWHTPPRKEGPSMTDREKENWAGVLLTALVVGLMLGALLLLRLTTNQALSP